MCSDCPAFRALAMEDCVLGSSPMHVHVHNSQSWPNHMSDQSLSCSSDMMLTICGSSTLHMRLANPPQPVLPVSILTVLNKLFPPPKYTEAGIGQGSINRCTAHCCQSSIFRPVPVVTTGVKRATGFHMRSFLLLLLQYFKQLLFNQTMQC